MAENTADRARQLVDRLANDAQFRESIEAAPTLHDKAEIVKAAGYGDVMLDEVQEAVEERAAALGEGALSDLELELLSGGFQMGYLNIPPPSGHSALPGTTSPTPPPPVPPPPTFPGVSAW